MPRVDLQRGIGDPWGDLDVFQRGQHQIDRGVGGIGRWNWSARFSDAPTRFPNIFPAAEVIGPRLRLGHRPLPGRAHPRGQDSDRWRDEPAPTTGRN